MSRDILFVTKIAVKPAITARAGRRRLSLREASGAGLTLSGATCGGRRTSLREGNSGRTVESLPRPGNSATCTTHNMGHLQSSAFTV